MTPGRYRVLAADPASLVLSHRIVWTRGPHCQEETIMDLIWGPVSLQHRWVLVGRLSIQRAITGIAVIRSDRNLLRQLPHPVAHSFSHYRLRADNSRIYHHGSKHISGTSMSVTKGERNCTIVNLCTFTGKIRLSAADPLCGDHARFVNI